MNAITMTLAVIGLVAHHETTETSAEDLGRYWFEKRAEGSVGERASIDPINKAIMYYEEAFKSDPTESNGVALMQSYYFKASFVPLSEKSRGILFEKGKDLGENLIIKFRRSAPVKYWLAAHWGKWAKVNGAIPAVTHGVADRIKTLGEEVVKLDPYYNDAGGYELLGLVHLYTPRIPFVMEWPSDQEALKHLVKAVKIAPTIQNHYCLAMAYHKTGDYSSAKKTLDKLLKMKANRKKLVEDNYSLCMAAKLVKEIN